MKFFFKPFHYLYVIYALLVFIILMILVMFFVLLVLPLNKITSGNLIYKACNLWARLWFVFIGIRHKAIYEAPFNNKEHYIFVSNHSSYMDIPCMVRTLNQPVRILGKHDMVKYPIFGIIYKAAVIVVDRSDAAHRAQSIRDLNAALSNNLSVFICPEGTFNETNAPLKNFYDGAFRIAIETQTPIKPLLFIDSEKRLHWSNVFSLNPGWNRVVYLPTVEVSSYKEDRDIPLLKKTVYELMEAGLRRYNHYSD